MSMNGQRIEKHLHHRVSTQKWVPILLLLPHSVLFLVTYPAHMNWSVSHLRPDVVVSEFWMDSFKGLMCFYWGFYQGPGDVC